jgi:nucleotide-binding universal stress UspA family protein
MMRKILVAIDGSEHAGKALDLAVDMAKRYEAELIILHVVPYEPMPEALRQIAAIEHIPVEEEAARYHYGRTLGDGLTREGEARAREAGVERVVALTAEGRPAEQILAVAVERDADAILLGSRGLGDAKALLMGSVSHKVSHLAECVCITVK